MQLSKLSHKCDINELRNLLQQSFSIGFIYFMLFFCFVLMSFYLLCVVCEPSCTSYSFMYSIKWEMSGLIKTSSI